VTAASEPTALLRRLEQAASHFAISEAEVADLVARGQGPLLARLAELARDQIGTDLTWLLIVATTATFPSPTEFRRAHRALRISRPGWAHRAILAAGYRNPPSPELIDAELDIVVDAVVVDVDFCAKHAHNTGIQRVVRQTMARWSRDHGGEHGIVPVAWTDDGESMRRLDPVELGRVVAYGSAEHEIEAQPVRLVVPWRSSVVMLEVPWMHLCGPLEALAEFSGNRVGVLGYDAIPVVSADTVPDLETERFVKYLSVVKHTHRVAGISAAATEEFAGFVSAVAAQGLPGPSTVAVPLPVDVPDATAAPAATATKTMPSVLCVGSHEPRKNHGAVLFAAEALWREGLRFSLTFIGGGSLWYTRRFDREIDRLRSAGHAVEVLRGIDDATLLRAYGNADFTVFPSLHEGYGLPVAESLALGVPVITSDYGSTAEIAADGGCLVIDPRDDDELTDAMRSLLTDPATLADLRAQITRRPRRTWDDFAAELWTELVEPLAGSTREVTDARR
jgi:glycosyltransferase involved in cell wall biosynthesis